MKIRFIFLLSMILLVVSLSACDKSAKVPVPKVYRVGMNAAFAPFGSINTAGKIVGFDVDIMQAIADRAGLKITWVNTPWEGIFSTLANADIDIIASGVTITDERKQSMLFSDPYFEAKQVILVGPGRHINSLEDLHNVRRVGVTAGTSADVIMSSLLGKNSSALVRFESLPLLLEEVDNGSMDAAVGDNGAVENYLKFNSKKGFKLLESSQFKKEYYGIAVRPTETELLAKINEGLKALYADGGYQKIYNNYFAN